MAFTAPPVIDLATLLIGFGDQLNQIVHEILSMVLPSWRQPLDGVWFPSTFTAHPVNQQHALMSNTHPIFYGTFFPRQRHPVNDITCFNCLFKGHYAKDCPQP